MYYRLYDNQTNRFMATGYNSESEQELADEYLEYIAPDIEEDEEDEIKNLSVDEVMDLIRGNEFYIESSEFSFDEDELED